MITVIVGIVCFLLGAVFVFILWESDSKKLCKLVKELAECLYGNPCTGCASYSCAECKHRCEMDSLVERVRKMIGGAK